MINIYCENRAVGNSVYHLVKAFLPREEVRWLPSGGRPFLLIEADGSEAEEPRLPGTDRPKSRGGDSMKWSTRALRPPTKPRVCRTDQSTSGKVCPTSEKDDSAKCGKSEETRSNRADRQNELFRIERKTDKYTAELALYDYLSETLKEKLPWGVLTGVRPVKLAAQSLESMSKEEFVRYIGKTRRVSPEKASLSYDIALKERAIIRRALRGKDRDTSAFSIYIGIPICPSVCGYCSFSSGPLSVWGGRLDEYTDALENEMKRASEALREREITSVYIGGGTPTVLSADQLRRIGGCLRKYFPACEGAEFTLEAGRPDTITKEKLEAAKEINVTRISVNPQSMRKKTLDAIGRNHTPEQTREAFFLAREKGFNNINMDIIMGLPGESAEDFSDTLRQIEELSPDSLTVHSLAVKRAAAARYPAADAQVIEKMSRLAARSAKRWGLEPYYLYRQKNISGNFENIGYALFGKECVYNIMMMEEAQSIAAFGAGAVSKVLLEKPVSNPDRADGVTANILRCENVKSIPDYITGAKEAAERKIKFFATEK